MSYLLPLLLLVPAVGAIIAAVLPRAESAKIWAMTVSSLTAVLAIGLWIRYPFDGQYPLHPTASPWATLETIHFSFALGIDAISLFLVLLTCLLVPLSIAASFKTITEKPRQYYAWMLTLMACMIGVFIARDLLLFYAFFELTLVPSYFLIGVWGGSDRRHAATKFFLYTFTGSVFTLAAIVYLGGQAGSFDFDAVTAYAQQTMSTAGHPAHVWIALGLLGAFAVKSALFPVHTWLPSAYGEAPAPVTVILAGVMPKLGTYGILRLVIPLGLVGHGTTADTPTLSPTLVAVIGSLAVAGILYGALIAWVQRDMKRLLGYSSFSHLGFILLGLMSMSVLGAQGAVLYMVNHGISTGALFLCVGMLYDRFKTTDMYEMSGLARTMPKLAFFLVLFAFSSIGLPGLNGFASEWLTTLSAFVSKPLGMRFGVLAALGVILSAIYMLHMVRQVLMGPLKAPLIEQTPKRKSIDLSGREITILTPLAVLVVLLGFFPTSLFLRYTDAPVTALLRPVDQIKSPALPVVATSPVTFVASSNTK